MQIFVENIEDDILFLTFYRFSWWMSIFEVNILCPIIVFSFCDINVDLNNHVNYVNNQTFI